MSCIICNSNQEVLAFTELKDWEYETHNSIDFYRCENCGLLSQKPLPEISEIPNFYPKEYRNYLPIGSGVFSQLKKMKFINQAKKLSSFFDQNSSILEIGYGNGELLLAFKDLGYKNLYGCDFSNAATERLIQNGIQVQVANVEEQIPFMENFDIIILNNVIEHFLDPISVIKNCYAKLKPGSKLILFTPNANALDLSIYGKYWAGFHAPRHTYIFNKNNLSQLSKTIGFLDIRFYPDVDPGQWAISLQNRLQDSILKTKLKNGLSWYIIPMILGFIPISLIQSLFGESTSILSVLKK